MKNEEVCAMDEIRGPLVVRTQPGSPSIRLALRAVGGNDVVHVTYQRTAERDAEGRPIYR